MCNHIPLINFHYTMCFCYCTYFSIYFLCKKLLFFNYFSLFIHILYKKIVPIFRLLFLQYQACIWLQPFPFSLLSANHPHRLPYFPVLHRLIQLQHFHPLIPRFFDTYILHCSSPSSSHAFSFLGHPFK